LRARLAAWSLAIGQDAVEGPSRPADPLLAAIPGRFDSVLVVRVNALLQAPLGKMFLECEDELVSKLREIGIDVLADVEGVAVAWGDSPATRRSRRSCRSSLHGVPGFLAKLEAAQDALRRIRGRAERSRAGLDLVLAPWLRGLVMKTSQGGREASRAEVGPGARARQAGGLAA
jgi:hypothetical protein